MILAISLSAISACQTNSLSDKLIGKVFYTDNYNYWSLDNPNKKIDKVEDESYITPFYGKRYYITWYKSCQYSLLTENSQQLIIQVRVETNDSKDCTFIYRI